VASRPAVVAFDVIGTLMSLEPLRARLAGIGQPPHLLEAWYTRTLRDGMALSAAGDYAAFGDVAAAALRCLAGAAVSDEQAGQVVAGFGELPAFGDALPAITRLAEAGVRVACLSNGTAGDVARFVNRAGLGELVDRVISVGEVYRWKPAGVVYRYAAEVMRVPPDRMALVAAHDWDCHGAKRAGLTTGWVARGPGRFGALFQAPDVTGADLTEVAAGLLALGSGPGPAAGAAPAGQA
jgi:2-haloacid dehalogenase